jgi:hypothetical protein
MATTKSFGQSFTAVARRADTKASTKRIAYEMIGAAAHEALRASRPLRVPRSLYAHSRSPRASSQSWSGRTLVHIRRAVRRNFSDILDKPAELPLQ